MQTPGSINGELRCHTCSIIAQGIIRRMKELREANKDKVSVHRLTAKRVQIRGRP